MKIRALGAELFLADGHDEANSRFSLSYIQRKTETEKSEERDADKEDTTASTAQQLTSYSVHGSVEYTNSGRLNFILWHLTFSA
jgi:hypothetical protein